MEIISKIIFGISLIVLLISLYEVFTIGWGTDPKFLLWSILGGISLIGVMVTAKSFL